MSLLSERFEARQLHALVVAVWGACGGVLLTMLLLLPGLGSLSKQANAHHPDVPPVKGLEIAAVVPWQELLEKRMYFLHCVCCPGLAWLSLKLRSRLNGWACLLSFVLFVPAICAVYRGIFQAEAGVFGILGAILTLSIAWVGALWQGQGNWSLPAWLQRLVPSGPVSPLSQTQPCLEVAALNRSWIRRFLLGLCLLALLVVFFFPYPIRSFASSFSNETHIASYLIGPGLSFLNPRLTPGLDFESHYGVGHAYVFSCFFGSSFQDVLYHYVWFLFVVIAFFYFTTYFVLADFFNSDGIAFLATVFLAAVGMEGIGYNWPSNWPVRYPFLFLFIACATRETFWGSSRFPVFLAGALAGLSLFWQTDIGLFLLLAGLAYYVVLTARDRGGLDRAPLFVLATAGTFVLLCWLAFGSRTLSLLFYRRLLDPLLVYNSGFGFWLMNWRAGWSYLYNIVGPVIALATIGFCVKRFCSSDLEQRKQARFLFLCAVIGLLMLFKWVNRSIDPVWSINAVGVVLVLFWWIYYGAMVLGEFLESRRGDPLQQKGIRPRTVTVLTCFLILLGLGLFASLFHERKGDLSSSPLVRITRFTARTPTLANKLLRGSKKHSSWCPMPLPVDPVDVDLIRSQTDPMETVYLLSSLDWVYLTEARRAPAFPWVPVHLTYTNRLLDQFTQRLQQANRLFVQRDTLAELQSEHPTLYHRVLPILQECFALAGSGKALDVYLRKSLSPSHAGQAQRKYAPNEPPQQETR